jgi:glycosyltransferase involved in cell wall biosynthesis
VKIVHFIWSFETGGAEVMLADIVNRQAHVEAVSLVIGNDVVDSAVLKLVSSQVRIVLLKRKAGSLNPLWILRLSHLLRAIQPDIIHCHNASAVRALVFERCPKVVTIHDTRFSPDSALVNFDRVFAISSAVKHDIEERFPGICPIVVYNGIDFAAVSRRAGHSSCEFRMVQISRLAHEIKGQDILLRAISLLKSQYGVHDLRLDFIGEGTSRGYLSNLVEELGLSGCIHFRGKLPRADNYAHLCEYSVLVQPSRWEGFGLTVLEGIAAEIPVLVSDIEGPTEIISIVGGGYSFRSGDPVHCAEMLFKIHEDAADSIKHQALIELRVRAAALFDINATATEYISQYYDVLAKRIN